MWIYGGGETAGSISDPLYSGCNIAVQDTVLVSLNYRLGPLGFLALPSAGIHGNFAIQDILLALRWVQSNIAAFGGNPVSFRSLGGDITYCSMQSGANQSCGLVEQSSLIRTVCWSRQRLHHQYA